MTKDPFAKIESRKREAIYLWKQVLDIANPEDIILNDIKKKLEKNNAG